MVSPTPPDFIAESAKNPDHIGDANKMVTAGLPSEEDIARAMMAQFYADWFAPGRIAHNGSVYWDFANGSSAWSAQAKRILDLIRPAFEAKDAAIMRARASARKWAGWHEEADEQLRSFRARALSAEAKLAQAVEDEHKRCWVHVTSAMANETQAAQRRVLDAFRRAAAARGEKT